MSALTPAVHTARQAAAVGIAEHTILVAKEVLLVNML